MSIPRYQDENYGSLIRIEYIAAWKLSGFTLSAPGQITSANILFRAAYAWEQLYCGMDTMGHQQTMARDDNGESWLQSVIGFVPGDEAAIEAGLLALTNQRYVVKITRPNGMIKIVGSPDDPLDFKLDSNSQITVPATAGTAISFTGLTRGRALILTA